MIAKGYQKPGASSEGISGHMAIAAAIGSRDPIAAENAMAEHLERSKSNAFGEGSS